MAPRAASPASASASLLGMRPAAGRGPAAADDDAIVASVRTMTQPTAGLGCRCWPRLRAAEAQRRRHHAAVELRIDRTAAPARARAIGQPFSPSPAGSR